MTEWLNHRADGVDLRMPLAGFAALGLVAAWVFARGTISGRLMVTSAGVFGWAITMPAIAHLERRAMPLPKSDDALTRVVMDRTVCDSTLPLAGFISGKPDGYGIFERWIL